jgi:hypothetical protein
MAKIPKVVHLAGYEVPVNPEVKPKNGIWMEIDPNKYVERRGRPRLVTNRETREQRLAGLEAEIAEFKARKAKVSD